MKRKSSDNESRKLVDRLAWGNDLGPLRGVLGTTFDLNPEFFETDFLPTILGLGAWDDQRYTSRILMERELAKLDAVSIFMDARRYQGRPRSLRVELIPAVGAGGQTLHAKVLVVVHENAVRLFVGSANLTADGYRHNREVALSLVARKDNPAEGSLIRAAIEPMPTLLSAWWTDGASRVLELAREKLDAWNVPLPGPEEAFVWGGGATRMYDSVSSRWPTGDGITKITIVSPFWSETQAVESLQRFLGALSERASIMRAELHLLTSAVAHTQSGYRPVLPEQLGAFDGQRFGVNAQAIAVDPRVDKSEFDGASNDMLRERQLHAKVVLIEGARTSLAYFGSANFTAKGFGFLADPLRSNIEAGIILVRTGKARDVLKTLIPKTTGDPVCLDGKALGKLALPPAKLVANPWPAFIKSILLAPSAADSNTLELLVEVIGSRSEGSFSVSIPEGKTILENAATSVATIHRVALDGDTLGVLLKEQIVLIAWAAVEEPVRFPINVAPAARERIPLGPTDYKPGERELLAYYQGRIEIEDLYPDENGNGGRTHAENTIDPGTGVDTSKIQSYQIREFVEALHGIGKDLRECVVSEPAMRLSLLGTVSPVALALEIMKMVRAGERSPTAGAFQLVELLVCLAEASRHEVDPKLREAWQKALREARIQIERALEEVRQAHPKALGHDLFRKYEKRCGCRTTRVVIDD